MKFTLFNKPQNSKLTLEQQKQAFNTYIWQIQLGYKVKIAIGTVSAVFTFGSVALFYTSQIEQSHLNIGIGVISSVVGFKSASNSKNELKELLESCEIVNGGK
ncbi:MAG: hypothetical protein ACK4WN_12315 [Aphanizomenon sp.]|jgi:hypothetical protein|uniref:hypothetical protein n=1 Tax=Anabaena sp. AL09 TaxID=1710891 RepID=UPI0007FFACEF|nr:hypothetical protein [Anabaena sp. AL09]OBQ14178.1 MAG: hypothetical protein AN490_00790 [Anabaena sp. AL09]